MLVAILPARAARAADTQQSPSGVESAFASLLGDLDANAAQAHTSEPEWVGPLVAATALLDNRARFDASRQHSENNTSTTQLDGTKGVGIVVDDSNEISDRRRTV